MVAGYKLQFQHIEAASALLKQQFPKCSGLQSTLYLSNGRIEPQQPGTIQIHFESERQHWIVSTYAGNTVRYFDSLYNGSIQPSIAHQIQQLYGGLSKVVTVQVMRVHYQHGATDCGLYAIAYATHLAHGLEPTKAKNLTRERCGNI